MAVHSTKGSRQATDMDLGVVYDSVMAEVPGICGAEKESDEYVWVCGYARFQHMFSGFRAAYYT
jgi:hypothetical protein